MIGYPGKSTKIRSLYYPDISAVSGNHLPGVLKQIGNDIVKSCDPGIVSNQRIYISKICSPQGDK
jgi:hypothetical protein